MNIMPHHQFISRNQHLIADMIQEFLELNDCYENQFSLYLDRGHWELIDMRVSITIVTHPFKHVSRLREDIIQLRNDLIGIYWANSRTASNNKPKLPDLWSVKRLFKIYGYDPKLFSESLINYMEYGIKETKDC